jgi:hypothetical protein
MDDKQSKQDPRKEEMEKQEAERRKKLAGAKKEIETSQEPLPDDKSNTDEQVSDGSANAFENK